LNRLAGEEKTHIHAGIEGKQANKATRGSSIVEVVPRVRSYRSIFGANAWNVAQYAYPSD